MTPFWYAIVALACLAGIINFAFAAARRKRATTAIVRVVAGIISIALAGGILFGKAIAIAHPYITKENAFIGFGIFVTIVFFVPSYIERATGVQPKVSLQERAARPANATVRLRDIKAGDEWVN